MKHLFGGNMRKASLLVSAFSAALVAAPMAFGAGSFPAGLQSGSVPNTTTDFGFLGTLVTNANTPLAIDVGDVGGETIGGVNFALGGTTGSGALGTSYTVTGTT